MTPLFILFFIALYFAMLVVISWRTGRNADNNTFFIGNRKSPWYLVAFGMIGASLSGVTFISIPGWVGESQFSYLQMVLGYLAGYAIIAYVLMPVYYHLQLTSIYTYLNHRFGSYAYKTGASFFLLSRSIGSALRLYLSASVLQIILFDPLHVPFWLTTVFIIFFIWLFTFRGGIRTVVWTDTIQTAFMLLSLVLCIVLISHRLGFSATDLFHAIRQSEYSRIFFFDDWFDKRHFIKQFLSGMLITLTMTGLDQDLMQKNLSCRNLREAQKNMCWFSLSLVPVNIIFLSLGALLYLFAHQTGMALPARSDDLFPMIATQSFMPAAFLAIFTIGLVSTTYSSADSALTSLTTSFTIDIINVHNRTEQEIQQIRQRVHVLFAMLMVVLILLFRLINNQSVVSAVFTAAGYTYGPLLGLYAFGLFTPFSIRDKWVPFFAIASPFLTYMIKYFLIRIFNFDLGFLILGVNGLLMFGSLFIIREKEKK